ncbi:thiopeptide-type bacteriocin biosynthesis protein [Catenuloplanes indicus]|uniref:Thiopeptide-type bacteriocin biosynthesis protein n=1 Tax=Catenuloplanes indicus TaxID=137267 RepID=A0AAE4AY63_9ACTN|nr:thiopeptide-type bacteriocin biosynthesis protein [Catenuloplanes indicus]MDQ0366947.1 thiopeptide-type bacteriocin biosynthesis protein [Catenuloplanes indicus]
MSTDHLTATPLADTVQRVLAGTPLPEAAASTGVSTAELADAVDIYQAAGRAALQHHTDHHWYQVRIAFPDWAAAEHAVAHQLGPRLDELYHQDAIGGWWFLRKHPQWRLRFADPDITTVHRILDGFTATGGASRWWPAVYEPETTAFGGPTGIAIAHELFCADSRGVLHYLRQPRQPLGRRELSLLLLGGFLHAAGLDWFERGDVFARVAQLRPTAGADDSRLNMLADNVRALLAVPDTAHALFQPGGAAHHAAPWHTAHTNAGQQLAAAAANGTLHRGIRAVTAHIVIFHWNRLGLSAATQGILARAATTAFLPRS